MGWWEIILCVLINGILFIPIIYELISANIVDYKRKRQHQKTVNEKNSEYIKEHGLKIRRLCVECSYCRWRWHHPFHKYGKLGHVFVTKTPYYCKKFKQSLRQDPMLRCISELHNEAMHESSKE